MEKTFSAGSSMKVMPLTNAQAARAPVSRARTRQDARAANRRGWVAVGFYELVQSEATCWRLRQCLTAQ